MIPTARPVSVLEAGSRLDPRIPGPACRGRSRSRRSRRVPGRTRSGRSTIRSAAPPRPWRARGHRVLIVAPARAHEAVRATREALRTDPRSLLPEPGAPPRVLAVGEVLPEITATRRAPVAAGRRRADHRGDARGRPARRLPRPRAVRPVDLERRAAPLARAERRHVPRRRPSGSSPRSSRAGSSSSSSAASTPASPATRRRPSCSRSASPPSTASSGPRRRAGRAPAVDEAGGVHIVVADEEERGALRLVLRALRRLDPALPWRRHAPHRPRAGDHDALRADLRARMRVVGRGGAGSTSCSPARTSSSRRPTAPRRHRTSCSPRSAAGAVPVASRLPVYEELIGEGEHGLLFEPRDVEVLAAQLGRLVADAALRARAAPMPRRTSARPRLRPPRRRARGRLRGARRAAPHAAAGRPGAPPVAARPRIDVDLHMHTDHSRDCATPVEVLLATAREQGLGAIAVTDHNEISGALDAAEKAAEFGVKVIVGEEVKTASQGEVIGLFLAGAHPARPDARGDRRRDPAARAASSTSRTRSTACTPCRTTSTSSRSSTTSTRSRSTTRASRSARSTRRPRASPPSTGSSRAPDRTRTWPRASAPSACGCPTSTARRSSSTRCARPRSTRSPSSLLYVQALKFLQTKATPPGARKASRERRVRRATRNG